MRHQCVRDAPDCGSLNGMGHWGVQPWQNDAASDWLDSFAEQTQLSARIEAGLSLPLEQIDEIRAAAFLLLKFGEAGTGVVDEAGRLLPLAIGRLSEAIESGLYSNPEFVRVVLAELTSLRRLIAAQSGSAGVPDPVLKELTRVASEELGLTQHDVVDVEGRIPESRVSDIVGTGFLDAEGVLHLRLEDGRENGFVLQCRCVPDNGDA